MSYVAVILLVWAGSDSGILRIDVADMPTCQAMAAQITSENTSSWYLKTRCVGVPGVRK